ncbi:hypothetical protein G6F46_005306 [Rhizopus delemar]|uniref:Uncharacterized protein n=3 Tax=Rhizopus TaxID=4842 RepID=I1BH79_RHIO9|nr:hypothetical protein RO3G_00263 [Rhizopus delemar RA 99-880]KAG1052079.1 hypothetical protein G6F43_005761 [Rhizopus delemar]KAG1547585.1 hypothetical protein G6F51_004175 [Rhizopus arrhizus]KAG1464931.1 hypothetical protein G6F55_001458 [Rhizopus delemar]KAG1497652.1 hypothetical protein G6F54_005621 [Rhizopus delemar]|eukprot:EIE75559.1 hypothetical protein RO3G_00263 [Rhizopus delemar RA 99-880]
MEKPQKEKAFSTEDITAIIKEVVEGAIGDADYTHTKSPGWNNAIVEGCLKKLKDKNKSCKYVVTCVIMQKKGAGFYAGTSVYWDNENDGK